MCKKGIYLVCDYPTKSSFLEAVRVCDDFNMDFLEIGFPFSDPVADGSVIEAAAFDVLKKENVNDFIESTKEVKKLFKNKLYIMTYANIVFGYGMEKFAEAVEFVDGLIIADLPYIESRRFKDVLNRYCINLIHFVTPESSYADIDKIKKTSSDFIYFVSTRGITGGAFSLDDETRKKIIYTKQDFKNDVIVGFGIQNKKDIEEACRYADGVVIGTEAVRNINSGKFREYIAELI